MRYAEQKSVVVPMPVGVGIGIEILTDLHAPDRAVEMRINACVAACDRPVAPDTAPRRRQRARLV